MDVMTFCRTLTRRADSIEERRALYRSELAPHGYRGGLHIAYTIALGLSLTAGAWSQVQRWTAAAQLGLAGGVLASMCVIYFAHRFPMHHASGRAAYDLHTRCHHMLFDRDHLEIRSLADIGMVMLPKFGTLVLCVVVFPLIAAPLTLVSWDATFAFLGCVQLYFLAYELVHLAAHAPDQSRVHRTPGLGFLTRHHRRHHDWRVMHSKNFAMVLPLFDYLFGTAAPPEVPAPDAR
ncbi:MAG: sterol desaturase family protein [Myxococcota bacterium]